MSPILSKCLYDSKNKCTLNGIFIIVEVFKKLVTFLFQLCDFLIHKFAREIINRHSRTMLIGFFEFQLLTIIVNKMLIRITICCKQEKIFATDNLPQLKNQGDNKMPKDSCP